jgi:hypothetical protein
MVKRMSYTEAGASLSRPKTAGTIARWATRGLAGEVLETEYVGNTPVVTEEALARFLERVSTAKRAARA